MALKPEANWGGDRLPYNRELLRDVIADKLGINTHLNMHQPPAEEIDEKNS
jgi:hypothetical protein